MLTQSEAKTLIDMPKRKANDNIYEFPHGGEYLRIPIVSEDGRESFLLDVNRGRIRLSKCTYQERYQDVSILLRLDIGGPPHGNPKADPAPFAYLKQYNGQEIQCPHLHIYVEGYNDKWAIPAPIESFPQPNDLPNTLDVFFAIVILPSHPLYRGDYQYAEKL